MQIKTLLFLSAATSLVSARLYRGGCDINYDKDAGRVVSGGCNCDGPYQAVQVPVVHEEPHWGGLCGIIGDAIGCCASLFSSLCFGGGFGGFCHAANLDPVAGQFLAMNVTAAIGGLDHIALQTASDDEISSHVNALAQQFDVPVTYIGSVSGGMAEVLFSKDSTASPHFGTYVAINKAVFNPQNTASAPQSETESTDSTASVANGAGLIGIAAGVMSLFALFI
ncbi:hypothetical protein HDU98_001839 [Podochytrium sp. JEL0797]|nr:hypothetical protein HDU98_001839 [Podochytrium sp. JEL0797]